jgi:hypothetical protein
LNALSADADGRGIRRAPKRKRKESLDTPSVFLYNAMQMKMQDSIGQHTSVF